MSKEIIFNARRSLDSNDYIQFSVDMTTKHAQLKELHKRMQAFVTSYPRYFSGGCSMDVVDFGPNNMITMRVTCEFRGNWQDGGRRWKIRTKFMFALKDNLMEMNMKFRLPVQPVDITTDPERISFGATTGEQLGSILANRNCDKA